MNKAFVLGAGLGTRLGKLTERIPKPLIPVFGKPLIEFAFEHLVRHGITEFIVNTHHKADAYHEHFQEGLYSEAPITFCHEELLLGTGGGIDNVSRHLAGGTFMVYNGDILTDLPLEPLLETHAAGNHVVTLVIRSGGPDLHVAFNPVSGSITDIRNLLQTGNHGTHQFTGIYTCAPDFLGYLQHGKEHSVIPVFLKLIEAGLLGAVVIDDGQWWDLGTRESYLDAHRKISGSGFPSYFAENAVKYKEHCAPDASIAPGANIDCASHIGAGAVVGPGAIIRNSIVWPYGEVGPGVKLTRCVIRNAESIHENLEDAVI